MFFKFGNQSSVCMRLKRKEGIECLSGLEIDSMCVRKGQRTKNKAKSHLKDKYQYFFQFLIMHVSYDSDL